LRREELDLRRREMDLKDDKANRRRDMEKTIENDGLQSKVISWCVEGSWGTMSKMPQDAIELVPYFRSGEQWYVDYGV